MHCGVSVGCRKAFVGQGRIVVSMDQVMSETRMIGFLGITGFENACRFRLVREKGITWRRRTQ